MTRRDLILIRALWVIAALVLIARGDDLAKRRPKHGERDQDHERLDAPAGGERDRSGDP